MGRAGSGSHSSGGGSFSGGHHSGSSVSGGHHIGSSGGGHRAGSGIRSGTSSGRSLGTGHAGPGHGTRSFGHPHGGGMGPMFSSPRMPPRQPGLFMSPPPPPGPAPMPGRRRTGCLKPILISLAVMVLFIAFCYVYAGSEPSIQSSTIVRTKLEDSHAYRTGNVTDDIGWFESVSGMERNLKKFYDKTGVQPYVYFKAYDGALTSDEEKESWAKDYFDTEINDSDGFLVVYFAEEDTDNDVGFLSYVVGSRAKSVMDEQSVDIFLGYLDSYWPTDMSTDDMIEKSFTNTATAIMHVSTTSNDVKKYVLVAVIVIGGGIATVVIIKTKRKAEKEKAEETERILDTPLEKANSSTEDLIDKYK